VNIWIPWPADLSDMLALILVVLWLGIMMTSLVRRRSSRPERCLGKGIVMSQQNEANESCRKIVENADKPKGEPFIYGYRRKVLVYLCVFCIAITLLIAFANLDSHSQDCSKVSTNQTSSVENRNCRR
jgi:hypothetical protein